MLRKHRYMILSILLCALLGTAVGATWVQITGRRDMPISVVLGLGLITGVSYAALDRLLERRRTRIPSTGTVPGGRHGKAGTR